MNKIIIEHVDPVGIVVDTFQLTPSKKDMIGLSRVYIFEEDEPYQGFNEDGTFTICQGMGIYHIINVGDFEVVE